MPPITEKPSLLVVEDEPAMRLALERTLVSEGFSVTTADDGEAGLETASTRNFDLILLDVMMPRLSGYEVCKHLRRTGTTTPVLMLTAKGLVDDRVTGLDSGADDYLVKPFSLRELLARIRALLRRFDHSDPLPASVQIGTATIDLPNRTITKASESYTLGEKEIGMLRLLIRAKGEPIDREKFLDAIWSDRAYPSTRTVDNFILALRQKIEVDPAKPCHILTIRGQGYRLQI